MKELTNFQMIEQARIVLHPRKLSYDNAAGDVACALLSSSGNLYLGVCIDISSGIGFCAEHSAIAEAIARGDPDEAERIMRDHVVRSGQRHVQTVFGAISRGGNE